MNCNTREVTRNQWGSNLRLPAVIFALLAATGFAWAAVPAFVPVDDQGNASDATTGFGAVNYAYRIGANEVTRAEYAAFLNAVAASDAHGLYNPNMGITRTGSPGSYVYAATEGTLSVAWVSWYDALRYANWLNNGQPSGALGASSTETGAYTFSGEANASPRDPAAKVFLPNENEWYKAAYYQGGADAWYWTYPTRSDGTPLASLPSGNDNAANFDRVASDVTPAGAYAGTQGYYGTHDQAGNLWEWNETAIGSDRGLRGGSYDDYPLLLQSKFRDSQDPYDENEFVGFRVAAAAPPPNRAPVASAESYAVDESATLTVAAPGVLANDTDADGNTLTVVRVGGPSHGTLTLYVNGAFTYSPSANYSGTDGFSYKPNDGIIDGNTVTVTITVRPAFYALTVGSGSGGGSYAAGTVVTIQADAAPAGMVFDRWAGDTAGIANVTSSSTTLTMQGAAVTVTATYKVTGAIIDVITAVWTSSTKYLNVRGLAPAKKTVVVTDPATGKKLGSVTSRPDGSWTVNVKRYSWQVPRNVMATCNGMKDEMPVTRK